MPRIQKKDFPRKNFFEYVGTISGRKGVRVLGAIGEGATDEAIEDKTKIKIAEIRSLLNQLHNYGLISYTREKNLSNGWFTYTWKFNLDRAMRNFIAAKKREYEETRARIGSEEGAVFYKCTKGCGRFVFDSAFENGFRCPRCNTRLKQYDNSAELKQLNARLEAIREILENQSNYIFESQ